MSTRPPSSGPVLTVRDLRLSYAADRGDVHAVDGVSFDLEAGKTLAIVGESGSGKTSPRPCPAASATAQRVAV